MKDNKTLEVYNRKIHDYVDMVGKRPSDYLKSFVKRVVVNGLVLDLGCGPGNASAFMNSCGLATESFDASKAMVNWANKHFGINAKVKNFDDLDGVNIYDGVYANFSLLHATKSDFEKHLSDIYVSMKPTAIFSLGMKLGLGEKRDKLGRFYAYYSEPELLAIINKLGFKIIEKFFGEEKGLAGYLEPWIVIHMKKL